MMRPDETLLESLRPGDRVVVRVTHHQRRRVEAEREFRATFLRFLPSDRRGPRMAEVGDTIPDDPAPIRVAASRILRLAR